MFCRGMREEGRRIESRGRRRARISVRSRHGLGRREWSCEMLLKKT